MTTYVLVPGFWLGGWAWRPVTGGLRARGHDVHPVTLTGLGDRVHLSRPEVDLDTHIDDVLNLLHYEDLHDVVLVGHSYATQVITGVADRRPDLVRRLVYVDTGPLPDGAAQQDFEQPDGRAANARLVAEQGGGWLLPPPLWRELAAGHPDVDEEILATLANRAVPQPWATAIAPAKLTGAWERLPRTAVLSSFTTEQTQQLAATVPVCRHLASAGWRYVELPTWHWPMFSRPADLTEILAGAGEEG
jgi:pimeloyl-ACP methyl ester carboxylesterase